MVAGHRGSDRARHPRQRRPRRLLASEFHNDGNTYRRLDATQQISLQQER